MGGLYIYDNCQNPIGPLTFKAAVPLIKLGPLILPPLKRDDSMSKDSNLAKVFALYGLMKFVISCLYRLNKHQPMAGLEIMALHIL